MAGTKKLDERLETGKESYKTSAEVISSGKLRWVAKEDDIFWKALEIAYKLGSKTREGVIEKHIYKEANNLNSKFSIGYGLDTLGCDAVSIKDEKGDVVYYMGRNYTDSTGGDLYRKDGKWIKHLDTLYKRIGTLNAYAR